jgi:undecaprenyl-diphosphatase
MRVVVILRTLLDRFRIDVRILAVFLLIAAAAFAFLKLASEVAEGDTLGFDRWLMLGLRNAVDPSVPAGPAWLQTLMLDVTALGGWSVLTIVTIFAGGYLIATRKAWTALFLVAASAGGALFGIMLKLVFARDRPDLVAHLVVVHDASFPSGHAMNSAIIYLTLGALLAGAEKLRAVKIYLLVAAIALTLLIGFSRVYLGVHWPSDVLAGWSIGAAWALACSLLARLLRRNRTLEPSTAAAPPEPPPPSALKE